MRGLSGLRLWKRSSAGRGYGSGRIHRSRKPNGAGKWQEQKTYTWLTSLSIERVTPEDIAQAPRGHRVLEHGLFRVRDVSYDEDRLHGRKMARGLSSFRNVATDIIRNGGCPFVPDGWRDIASRTGFGLSFAT